MPRQFTMQDIQRLNVRNVSTIIDILNGQSESDYNLTHGVMTKYNSDTQQALQDQGLGPMPAGTELNPDDCEFCIEGLMVFLFEPESLTYIPFDEDDNWTYGYQTDSRPTTESAISDPGRFYPQHLGFSHKLASPSPERYMDEYMDSDVIHGPHKIARHWSRIRNALLSGRPE